MRLIEKNIKEVRETKKNNVTYLYYVIMQGGKVSDSREYINRDENGMTIVKEFKREWLPKAVQNFIKKHDRDMARWTHYDEDDSTYITYRIK